MKPLFFIAIILTAISCTNRSANNPSTAKRDTVVVHDTLYIPNEQDNDWQVGFGLTHDPEKDSVWGKPVNYYLKDKDCSAIAFEFYYGYIRPTDNGATAELLKVAYTDNAKLRPFYRWCLYKTIQVSDGALSEYTGQPARRYAERFPKEFFEYVNSDTSGAIYKDWVDAISYSGFYEGEKSNEPDKIRKQFASTMQKHCISCNEAMLKRIHDFALDCFHKE